MRVRIVVADRAEARFYDAQQANSHLKLVGEITDPQAHLHNRDFKSDRPGRVFDHASTSGGRRGAVAHHGTGSERTPLRHEAELFAKRICQVLVSGLEQGAFEKLVLMSEPRFLGVLREAMPESLMKIVMLQVHKDLVHQDEKSIIDHIPPTIFYAA